MRTAQSADGTRIAFQVIGRGAPLILVGGAFCDHRARVAGTPLAERLASDFSVTCYDRRGRGQSANTEPYAVARELEDLAALLEEAGGSAFVYGHSSGATLALEAALAGLRIGRLALYEPPLISENERALPPADLPEQLEALTRRGEAGLAAELFLTVAVGLPTPAVEQLKKGSSWASLSELSPTLSHDARITADPRGLLDRLTRLQVPALVMHGESSQPWLRAAARAVATALPHAQSQSLVGQTHSVDPLALAPVLAAFFAKGPD